MEDLLGWGSNQKELEKTQPKGAALSNFASLRPTPPISGRSTPLPKNSSNHTSRTQTPANDSFSNLVSFGSSSTNKSLSLEEQLKQKTRIEAAKQKEAQSRYNAGDEQFWNNLGGRQATPALQIEQSSQSTSNGYPSTSSNQYKSTNKKSGQSLVDNEDDILAAFNSDAPVDSSSHFPKPSEIQSGPILIQQKELNSVPNTKGIGLETWKTEPNIADDDDPFGLGQLPQQQSKSSGHTAAQADEDDFLGLLGKPVSEAPPSTTRDIPTANQPSRQNQPQDKALAELVDMGFSAERAREALDSTDSGTDVSQAVGWLLTKAHAEAKQNSAERKGNGPDSRDGREGRAYRNGAARPRASRPDAEMAWAKKDSGPTKSKQTSLDRSDSVESDPAQTASEFRTNFLKTAGSLWKTSTKKMQQAVQDLNSDSDSSQPRWMREPGTTKHGSRSDSTLPDRDEDRSRRKSSSGGKDVSVTDEALMLESDGGRPPPRKGLRRHEQELTSSADNSRDHSPAIPSRLRQDAQNQPAFLRQQQVKQDRRPDPKRILSRDVIEEQASQAYTSSARRRKPPHIPVSASKPDVLENNSHHTGSAVGRLSAEQRTKKAPSSPSPAPVVVRPAAPPRQVPSVSQISLKASHAAREAGNDHFKRGDYAAANQSYTSSLKHIPSTHPISVILLTNRALTSLKIGEAKSAISDADSAIAIIGPSRGEGEIVDLTNGESQKPMRDYLGKALMRKAEALEQMEKMAEAAAVWKEAVEGGHGGVLSVQGKIRCEKASVPKPPKPRPATQKPAQHRRPVNGTNRDNSSAVAVASLRAANAAAERADDEKFALTDSVNAKLETWKGTKVDNLRALLSSLDTVLWPEAGWKKIGMAELVLPGKVKVHYMKGIAKVHPDKVCFPC